jgi:lipase
VRLHAHTYGDPGSPPVVCVHGVTGHGERFRRLAQERLPDRRVVAVDLRGHGRSGYEPPWDLGTQVHDLIETADSLGIGPAAWVGFSFGGRLVAELAAHDRDRVERLALLDPALQLPPEFAYEHADDERADLTFASAGEAIDARYESGSVISAPRAFLEEEMRQHLVRGDDGRYRFRYSKAAATAVWGEMARPAVEVASVPTLLVLGTQSYVPNDGQRERYSQALGHELVALEIESGHSVLWDAFGEAATAVAQFVA